jgi:hypothetical protein
LRLSEKELPERRSVTKIPLSPDNNGNRTDHITQGFLAIPHPVISAVTKELEFLDNMSDNKLLKQYAAL